LRYLLAVADAGTVSAAASVVHVTQPSLSRQIRALEHELGIALFDRHGGRLMLSAAGRQFLPVARDLVTRADRAVATATDLASGRLRQLTIAAPVTTLTDVVAPFLAELAADDPWPTVWERPSLRAYAALAQGADLALGTDPPAGDVHSLVIAVFPVWAFVPTGHPFAGAVEVDLATLVAQTLVLPTVANKPRALLDGAVAAAGLRYGQVMESDSTRVAQAVAASGRGIAVVSDDARFGLRPLHIRTPHGPLQITLYAAWKPDHHAAPALRAIALRLRDFAAARYSAQTAALP